MPAGDVFGLDGIFLNKSNPIVVSTANINSTAAGAGIVVTAGTFSAGTATLTLSTAAGLSTTPFYTGAKIAVSGVGNGYNGTFNVSGFAGTTTVSYATTGYVNSVATPLSGLGGLAMLVTDTQVTNTTWISAETHGYFGAGGVTAVERIDFSNDTGTANIRGPLSLARSSLGASGNFNYGFFGGGSGPSSMVERIDYSNDSANSSVRGPLSAASGDDVSTGNANYGWFGRSQVISTVDRIDFLNDSSTASQRSTITTKNGGVTATGNSNYGYFGGGGGSYPQVFSSVERINFSNDLAEKSLRGPLSQERMWISAKANSNYGWFVGGWKDQVAYTTVDRIDFSNDSVRASPRGPLLSTRFQAAATGNSNYGWFGGGFNTGSSVDRIDFSNDLTIIGPRGALSISRSSSAATSGQARSSSTRLQKAGNYGWFGGGRLFPTTFATVDRINFSNDSSTASVRGSLNAARYNLAATGNSNYGWFGGGGFSSSSSSRSHRFL